jgi:hypothetical protein
MVAAQLPLAPNCARPCAGAASSGVMVFASSHGSAVVPSGTPPATAKVLAT